MNIKIRKETTEDTNGIYHLNCEAFETDSEAKIVDALRSSNNLILSLVAVVDEKVIGHIAYSPMVFDDPDSSVKAVALAPMAVHPDMQNKGIGSKLIRESLKELKTQDLDLVFLIGHPEYYPRFGFKPAFSTLGVKSNFEGMPDEVFMVHNLSEKNHDLRNMKVSFRQEFSKSL